MDILVANDVCIIQENMDIIRSSKSQETKSIQKEPSQRDGYTDAVKPLFRKNGVKVLNH